MAAIFFVSCSPATSPTSNITTQTIHQIELKNILYAGSLHGYNEVFTDEKYSVTTKEWVTDYFYPLFRKELFNKDILKWRPETNDCDDFSNRARVFAQELNDKSENKGKSALAVGILNYSSDIIGKHGINIFLIQNGDKIDILLFEPQTGDIVVLSEEEKSSTIALQF